MQHQSMIAPQGGDWTAPTTGVIALEGMIRIGLAAIHGSEFSVRLAHVRKRLQHLEG